jgi:hypothetical protein
MAFHWIFQPTRLPESPQSGIGRSEAEWLDATTDYLLAPGNLPSGEVINLPWTTGNELIFYLHPRGQRIYVDPRFETFPQSLILESMHAMESRAAWFAALERHQPGWLVVDLRFPQLAIRLRELLAGEEWVATHLDAHALVAVRVAAQDAGFLARQRLDLAVERPIAGLVVQPADLRGQQLLRVARALWCLGLSERAMPLLREAIVISRQHRALAVRLANDDWLRPALERLERSR